MTSPRIYFEAAVDWARGVARQANLKVVNGPPAFNPKDRVLCLPKPGSAEGVSPETAEQAAVFYRLFIGHEVHGHAKHSMPEVLGKHVPKLVNRLHQPLEDGFIERSACHEYPGLKPMLEAGYEALVDRKAIPDLQPPTGKESPIDVLHAFMWTHARVEGPGVDLTDQRDQWFEALAAHLPQSLCDYVWAETAWCVANTRSSIGAQATARRILQAVKDVMLDDQDPPDPSEGDSGAPSADPGGGGDDSDAADDGDTDDSDAGSGGGSGISDADAEELASQLDPNYQGQSDGSDGDTLSDAIASELSEAVEDVDNESRQAVNNGNDESASSNGGGQSGGGAGPGPESGRDFPRPRLDESGVAEIRDRLGSDLKRLKQAMFVALRSEGRVRTRTTSGGRIDPRRAGRIRMGDPRIWRAKRPRPGQTPAITLLLDVSGSVDRSLRDSLLSIVYAASEVIAEAGITAEIATFGGNTRNPAGMTFIRYAHESGPKCLARLPGVHERAGGGTPMAEGIGIAVPRLMQIPRERRIVLLFTDGDPNDRNAVIRLVRQYQKEGVEFVGFGYGQGKTAIEGLGMRSVPCDDINTLGKELMKTLHRA